MTIDEAFADDDSSGSEPAANVFQLSPADIKMESRGAVKLAPAKIDMAAGGNARSLDDSEVNAGLGGAGAMRDCVVRGATGTSLHGRVNISLGVDGSGKVTSVAVEAPHYLFEKGLYGCVQSAAGRLKFAAVGNSTKVDFPIDLN